MKSIIFFALMAFAISINAQEPKVEFQYCDLIGQEKLLSRKVNITLDFGQEMKWWKDQRLKDEKTGKAATFNSMIDALNYMGEDGWEFVQAYAVINGGIVIHHYLLKREVEL